MPVRAPWKWQIKSFVLLPVLLQAYSTPTVSAVIKHKWRLYARKEVFIRTVVYLFYALVVTITAILYSQVGNHVLPSR